MRAGGVDATLQALTEGSSQYLPSQRARNVSYISRLQCVQTALHKEFETMAQRYPNHYRAALVAFNGEVQVFGFVNHRGNSEVSFRQVPYEEFSFGICSDGSGETEIFAGDRLMDFDELYTRGVRYGQSPSCQRVVGEALDLLVDKVYSLDESGGTALGPSLVIALGMLYITSFILAIESRLMEKSALFSGMASSAPGSKVCVFTDGLANVGLGRLDVPEDQLSSVADFYAKLGTTARANGTTVNVISIRGSECSMENLGAVADITHGHVDIVDPIDLAAQLQGRAESYWNKPILATDVTVSLFMDDRLVFKANG
jgi:hypothetical protein